MIAVALLLALYSIAWLLSSPAAGVTWDELDLVPSKTKMSMGSLQNEDIKNTWDAHHLAMCSDNATIAQKATSASNGASPNNGLYCTQQLLRHGQFDVLKVEVMSRRPAVIILHDFVQPKQLDAIETLLRSSNIEEQSTNDFSYRAGYRPRVANGLWLDHDEAVFRPYYERLQRVLTLNPAVSEHFLILHYRERQGHYAPHYDHPGNTGEKENTWLAYLGRRVATALLLVRGGRFGSATLFPRLQMAVRPAPGDVLLWINADSNDVREEDSLHGACPFDEGEKIAVSLWIRRDYQETLKCSLAHDSYEPEQLIRMGETEEVSWQQLRHKERPPLPIEDSYYDDSDLSHCEGEQA